MPLPLYVISMTIGAADDLLWLLRTLFPGLRRTLSGTGRSSGRSVRWGLASASLAAGVLRDVWEELRRNGRWTMAEVVTEDVKILVDFY